MEYTIFIVPAVKFIYAYESHRSPTVTSGKKAAVGPRSSVRRNTTLPPSAAQYTNPQTYISTKPTAPAVHRAILFFCPARASVENNESEVL